MKKRLTMFLACIFLSLGAALAQTTISGTVISSEDGLPVIGASVKVVGTNIGIATDLEGRFSLSAPAGSKITVTSIGMQTLTLKGAANMKITLDPISKSMDEVMVVAYGTQKKSAFTGSAAVVKSKEIAKVQVTNAVDALKGKVSGVQMVQGSGQPGTSSAIKIRGIGSLNAGGSPLYVVDGVPFDGDLTTLSMQDVENLTVLKDAASAALYGARGANGVIMITTKTGRSNHSMLTVDAKWGVNSRAIPDYEYITDPAAYYELHYKGLYNYAVDKEKMNPIAANMWANEAMFGKETAYTLGYNVYTLPEGQYLIGQNGRLNPNATLGRFVTGKDGQTYWLTPDKWIDAIYRNSLRQEYSVTAVGSTNKSTFYSSVNYLDNQGITLNSDYKRLTGRLKADYQIKDWLKIGGNINYAHYTQHYISGEGDSANSGNMFALTRIAPIYPLFLRDKNKQIMIDNVTNMQRYDFGDDGELLGIQRPFLGKSNAIVDKKLNLNASEGNTINAIGTLEARFLKYFKFTSTNSIYMDETRGKYTVNPFYGQRKEEKGIVTVDHGRTYSYNLQQLLNWHRVFSGHDVEAMVGHEYYRLENTSLSGTKTNMFDPDYSELSGAAVTKSTGSGSGMYNTEGWFGRLHYGYGNKYFGEASYRRDATSVFDPSNRWGNFWSLGGAWLLSKESWFKASWVDELKFKASYGSQGNDNIGSFRYINTYTIKPSNGDVALLKSSRGNKNISWEKQGMFNIGFDFSLLRHRLSGSIVYFDRSTKDMLAFFSLPISNGWGGYYKNVGDMSNRGIELELNGDIIRTKDFVWSANFNLTSYKNRLVRLADDNKTAWLDGYQGYNDGDSFFGEGLSLYTYRLKKYAGVDPKTGESLFYRDIYKKDSKGNLVLDAHKQPIVEKTVTTTNPEDAQYHLCGTSLPDVYGGFGTGLTWKGFDFSIDFTYQIGGQCYDGNYASAMGFGGGGAMHVDLLKAWSKDNPHSNIPRVQSQDLHTTASSDRWLISASYLSLQNIDLGYTIPRKLVRTMGIQSLRFYATASNVWVWSKRQGLDPRQSMGGGVNNTSYSPIRTISGGLTLTF